MVKNVETPVVSQFAKLRHYRDVGNPLTVNRGPA